MKTIKSALAASVLVAAAGANATVFNLGGTINSQVPPLGTITLSNDLTLYGQIDVNTGSGLITSFWLATNGSYTATSSLGPAITFYADSRWDAITNWNPGPPATGGISLLSFGPDGSGGFIASYAWGDNSTVDSNAASTFSFDPGPPATPPTCNGHALCGFATAGSWDWDHVEMDVHLVYDVDLEEFLVTGVSLVVEEVGEYGSTFTSYSLEEVPLPAAAWLFGSGLIGLVGAARRRRAAVQA